MLTPWILAATLVVGAPDDALPAGPLVDDLALTDGQREALLALRDANRPSLDAARAAVKAARETLREVASDPAARDGALREASAGLGSALGELSVVANRQRLAMRDQLTGEQRARLDQRKGQRAAVREAVQALRDGRPGGGERGSAGGRRGSGRSLFGGGGRARLGLGGAAARGPRER